MKIYATEKAQKECAPITLEGNGVPPGLLQQFLDGQVIEVEESVATLLIENGLAAEGHPETLLDTGEIVDEAGGN